MYPFDCIIIIIENYVIFLLKKEYVNAEKNLDFMVFKIL